MAINRITTTRQRDLHPLGTAGQTTIESWSVLAALLTRELSPAHAALLAEPVVDIARGETDWYTESDATPVQLGLIDQQAQAAVRAEQERLERDIRALATRKRTAASEGERFLGEMLALALSVPSDDHVYAAGTQPILVAWGHARSGGAAEQVTLTGHTRASPVPMTILPPPRLPVVARRVWRWLLPSLLLSLLLPLLALWLLFADPFGWYVATAPACSVAPGELQLLAELRDAAAREAALRGELAQVVDEAGERRRQCKPIRVPRPAPAPQDAQAPAGGAPPPSAKDDTKRAAERGGKSGKLQIVLAWDDTNDLDLVVQCPGGEKIFFNNKQACGGHIDVDANGKNDQVVRNPVENIFFENPEPGSYAVIVVLFKVRDAPQSKFRVTIRRDGEQDQVVTGTAQDLKQLITVTRVEIAPP